MAPCLSFKHNASFGPRQRGRTHAPEDRVLLVACVHCFFRPPPVQRVTFLVSRSYVPEVGVMKTDDGSPFLWRTSLTLGFFRTFQQSRGGVVISIGPRMR